ncbi:alpha/beta-hydrolase [Agrocybe pediades]|nr:alpha/beta-hydrolase [Agrocybe pediades]
MSTSAGLSQVVKHAGISSGQQTKISGLETYLSEPPASREDGPKKVILYFSDVFGPFFEKSRLLQDYYASQGYHVLGLDYFHGDPIQNHSSENGFDRDAWFVRARKQAEESMPKWIKSVRDIYGADSKFNAVGYCFGGPYALEAATKDDFVAVAFAHPTTLNEDNIRKVKRPLLLSCAETDNTFPAASRRRAEDILSEIKATYHIQIFSGVSHGFAVRGDSEVENSRWAKEESARSIVEWFNRFNKG